MFLIIRPTYNRPAFNQPLPVGLDLDWYDGPMRSVRFA